MNQELRYIRINLKEPGPYRIQMLKLSNRTFKITIINILTILV